MPLPMTPFVPGEANLFVVDSRQVVVVHIMSLSCVRAQTPQRGGVGWSPHRSAVVARFNPEGDALLDT